MICDSKERTKRQPRRSRDPEPTMETAPPRPRLFAVFRRADQTVCHARCGRPLSLQGVRGLLEADFYCLGCLTHVSLPLAVLDGLPVVSEGTLETVAVS